MNVEKFNSITPQQCAEIIIDSSQIVAFTGAGISTSAGIADFRSSNGIYHSEKYNPDTVFDICYFQKDPSEFYRFSKDLLDCVKNIRPTFTHLFLAKLEQYGKLQAVITQNIDPLHHQAGSKKILPIHGSYDKSHCLSCQKTYNYKQLVKMLETNKIPYCECGGVIKPDVVFFGESVKYMEEAQQFAESCDLMLVLGSSLVVYPAAMIPQICLSTIIIVNKEEISLQPSLNRYFIKSDLDDFFWEVNSYLFE